MHVDHTEKNATNLKKTKTFCSFKYNLFLSEKEKNLTNKLQNEKENIFKNFMNYLTFRASK